MIDVDRLNILTESAKYDVSCSSSGSSRKNSSGKIGNTAIGGICHSFTPDGRCVSLLKILLSNKCEYDCLYCINRRSNDVPRASATPDEICELTMSFYKRNYIEGLFLSSAVEISPNHTMELLLETVIKLRKQYGFNGYIHLKGIPKADRLLIERAGNYVDRMSFNVELPSENSLKVLAPQKSKDAIFKPMKLLSDEAFQDHRPVKKRSFLPAGQTTQMIVGASPETDGQILRLTQAMYSKFKLKRVYFSSYVPVNFSTPYLPVENTRLLREHRLYQADWLLRFYGFTAEELIDSNGFLDDGYDPKCAWALKHPELFPVEINKAPLETLLRIPGIGVNSAYKIIQARRYRTVTYENLVKMRVVVKRAKHFITCNGKFSGTDSIDLRKNLLLLAENNVNYTQLSLFSSQEITKSVITGQL